MNKLNLKNVKFITENEAEQRAVAVVLGTYDAENLPSYRRYMEIDDNGYLWGMASHNTFLKLDRKLIQVSDILSPKPDVDDLTWFAQNIDEWPKGVGDDLRNSAFACHWIWRTGEGQPSHIAKRGEQFSEHQWLAKRQELEAQKVEQIVDGFDISQSDADEVVNPVTSSLTNSQARELNSKEILGSSDSVEQLEASAAAFYEAEHKKRCDIAQATSITDEEWDGEGNPPKGAICRINLAGNEFNNSTITYMSDEVFCYKTVEGFEYTGSIRDTVFHKILRKEQIAEEERKAAKNKLMDDLSSEFHPSDVMEDIIDRVADFVINRIAQGEGNDQDA